MNPLEPGPVIAHLAAHYPEVAEIFRRQYMEIRGTWELADWHDRAEATLRFYAEHEWNGRNWITKEPG